MSVFYRHKLIILETIGVLASAIAVTAMDFESKNPPMKLILASFILGNITIAYVSFVRKSFSVMYLMGYYLILNLLGLVKLFLNF